MEIEKPSEWSLNETEDPEASRPYVWESSEYFNVERDERSYSLKMSVADVSGDVTITYFPERPGMKMMADSDTSYEDGMNYAAFGIILMKLIQTGAMVVKEV